MYSQIILASFSILFTRALPTLPKQPLSNYNILEMPAPNKYVSSGTMRFPETFFHNALHRKPTSFKGIQYAPLHISLEESKQRYSKSHLKDDIKKNISNIVKVNSFSKERLSRKENLEPRIKEFKVNKNNETAKCYNLRFNTEVLPYASRSPGHNAVYRSFPQIVPRDKSFKGSKHTHSKKRSQVDKHAQEILKPMGPPKKALRKINHLKPYGIYQAIEVPDATNILVANTIHKKAPISLTNQQLLDEVEANSHFDLASSNTKRHLPQFVGKFYTNKLHMNVARIYSTGKQHRIPVFADTHSVRLVPHRQSRAFQPIPSSV